MCVVRQRHPLGKDLARSWGHDDEGGGGRRVLIESADGAEAHATWRLLRGRGYRTMWCPGPRSAPGAACVLTERGSCPLVDEADAVVSSLDLRDPACGGVVRDLDGVAEHKTVVVVAPRERVAELREELRAAHVVPGPLSAGTVLGALDQRRSPASSTS